MEDRKFAVLFAATILAARKLSELEAQGITRPCPAREIIITDAISKAEEIMREELSATLTPPKDECVNRRSSWIISRMMRCPRC
jgi:hypothetical protein